MNHADEDRECTVKHRLENCVRRERNPALLSRVSSFLLNSRLIVSKQDDQRQGQLNGVKTESHITFSPSFPSRQLTLQRSDSQINTWGLLAHSLVLLHWLNVLQWHARMQLQFIHDYNTNNE